MVKPSKTFTFKSKKASNPRGTEDFRNAMDASVRAEGTITPSNPKE